jgi:protocatechuate 3,4-dioxygenase beta subunit
MRRALGLRWPGVLAAALALGGCARDGGAAEPIVGLPCENCEIVFDGMPAELAAQARIAPAGEPGEPMVVAGTVRDAAGRAVPDVVVYAYHTDARGIYPRAETLHGRLRGWAKTGPDGGYRFETIRPAGYPGTALPQHVHFHVLEPGRCTYWIDDLLFEDDPRLTERERARPEGRGGDGIGRPARDAAGVWHARRDIVLGARVPGYEACGKGGAE